MKHTPKRPSAFRKSVAIFLLAALLIVGVSAAALAAPAQQPSIDQQPSIGRLPSAQQQALPGAGRGQVIIERPGPWRGGAGPLLRCGLGMAFLICLVCDVLLTIYVVQDAKRLGFSRVLWGVVVFLTTVLGLLIYLLYKQSKQYPELWQQSPRRVPGRACPNCHAVQNPANIYCAVCGAKMEVRCGKCGAPLSPEAVFCPVCGTRAARREQTQEQAAAPERPAGPEQSEIPEQPAE